MHEAAVCTEIMGIVERVAAQNDITKVSRINITVGPYSCIDEQQLNFYFHVAQEGTCMEGAWIGVERLENGDASTKMMIESIEGE